VKPFVILVITLLSPAAGSAQQNMPAPPRASVDIPQLNATGRTIRVATGGDLQKALDEANPGDRI
jgi:hypothetical protein